MIAKASLAGAPITTLAWSSRGTGRGVRLRGRTRVPLVGRGRRKRGGDLCADPALRGARQRRDASRLGPRRSGRLRLDRRHHAGLERGPGRRRRLYALCGDSRAAHQGRGFAGRPLAGGRRQGRQHPHLGRGGGLLSRTIKSPNESEVAALAWAQSGLLAAAHDGRGITIPPNAAQPAQEIDIDTDQDTRIAFAQHDRSIAMPLHSDKRVVLIEVAAFGTRARHYLEPIGPDQAAGLAADPSGQMLFVSYTDPDGEIRIWDLATRQPVGTMAYTLAEKRDPVAAGSLAVSRDGRWLATSGGDSYVRVYDIAQTKLAALAMDVTFDGPAPSFSAPTAAGSPRSGPTTGSMSGACARTAPSASPCSARSRGARRCRRWKDRERAATWLAWIGSDSIAVAASESAINVIGLDPAAGSGGSTLLRRYPLRPRIEARNCTPSVEMGCATGVRPQGSWQ